MSKPLPAVAVRDFLAPRRPGLAKPQSVRAVQTLPGADDNVARLAEAWVQAEIGTAEPEEPRRVATR
jgi:hypothetical protein